MIRIFADEGGYTNDPVDPGGATNWGITIFDARKYWKADASPADVKAMSKMTAALIYQKHYAEPLRYNDLPAGFDYSVLDAGINSGLGRAVPWAGKALGQPVRTINDVVPMAQGYGDKVDLIQKYWRVRLSFLQHLGTFWRFGKGWTRRCTQGEAAAVRMWLSVGLKLPAQDARKKMDIEADKAKKSAQKSGTGAATSGSGPIIGSGAFDWHHWTTLEWIAAGAVVFGLCLLVSYFIRQAIIHNQRAAAYSAA